MVFPLNSWAQALNGNEYIPRKLPAVPVDVPEILIFVMVLFKNLALADVEFDP